MKRIRTEAYCPNVVDYKWISIADDNRTWFGIEKPFPWILVFSFLAIPLAGLLILVLR